MGLNLEQNTTLAYAASVTTRVLAWLAAFGRDVLPGLR
jgi:hypothetical protein